MQIRQGMKKTSFQRKNRVEAQVETKYQMAFEVHMNILKSVH